MNPISEKVKDIVEVLNYKSIKDFDSDPRETLSSYRFTDITSTMMGRWLDRISMVHARGSAAFALAGYRGVGKSHFLAVLGAIVSHTELRAAVADPHVAAGAQRLLRRHYPVIYVRRGTADTLLDEFAFAAKAAFPNKEFRFDGTIESILTFIDGAIGDMPAIILVDTAFERGVRVSRDDGAVLAKLAQATRERNIFVGLALDDDIAGADGVNVDISRTYEIDYLDHEHLYTVVNRYVFPKHANKQDVLHDVYEYFRRVLPNFRWSEQKFVSLYPLHPSILEVAPFIRLHVHDFALLGFASEAGQRVLGRPAMSLIALDEVFDKVEPSLRAIGDLTEAFAAYDKLNAEVVSKIPIIQRLQAKLILKALLLLSLDGRGASAAEIAESMLIFDEADPPKAIRTIEEIISKFNKALPDEIRQVSAEGREQKFGFRMTSKDELNVALDKAAAACPERVVGEVLVKLFLDRYPDATALTEDVNQRSVECIVKWRGSLRRGRISFMFEDQPGNKSSKNDPSIDWGLKVELFNNEESSLGGGSNHSAETLIWRPDVLSLSERDTLKRFFILTTDNAIRTQFSDQIHAPRQSHSVAAARILKRSFLDDGKLVISGYDFNFSDDARESQSLTELLSLMLETHFETKYPDHPEFGALMGASETNNLISGLYGGSETPGFEDLVQNFAVPLGLVRNVEGRFEPNSFEQLVQLPYIANLMKLVESSGNATIDLVKAGETLSSEPFGLVREAQRLALTALVSARKLDFVTSKGDRINRRSLDLRIIWDDIVGIARSVERSLTNDRVNEWASRIAVGETFKALSAKEDATRFRKSLEKWYGEWRRERIIDRFELLADEVFNTRIWRIGSAAAKTFNAYADVVSQTIEGDVNPEECVVRIAAIFSDSDEEYARRTSELETIRHFVKGSEIRSRILSYTSLAQYTSDPVIEALRIKTIEAAELCIGDPSEARNREAGLLFEKFRKDYGALFTTRHDEVIRSHHIQEKFALLQSGKDWGAYGALADASEARLPASFGFG
ncbi:hypothetical protein [Leptolyngbya sp. 7M]|uniref:hypothetical protein n=1 Tax=Leptolyngbya sp. 7M TaxID=2812896 RepID=UPI001B8D30EA|nr:hypothetical protein [Leptolyngbya sp. 7M]QYO66091.1 hypothetical protein JVX88_04635 [Leptolyngbya sp. 7M]